MFPLGDADRRPFQFPLVTLSLVLANALVFLLELLNGDAFITRWAMTPANITAGRDWITMITSMFLHSGWLHIGGNMLFLWAFGPEIEDVMGSGRFFVFYMLGGIVAGLAQLLGDPTSTVPNLGASGAIAAVMGIFLLTYPRDRIRTVVFLFYVAGVRLIPAAFLVGLWFLVQVFDEIGAIATPQAGGVAYLAHIGGFLFGAVFGRLFETRWRREREGLE